MVFISAGWENFWRLISLVVGITKNNIKTKYYYNDDRNRDNKYVSIKAKLLKQGQENFYYWKKNFY